jgi:ankyrin repeat protein
VSRQDNTGRTPLHIAAKYNNLYAADKLLKAGCKIMTKDFKGKTPLDLAESKEMIKLLKKYGAKEH